VVAVKAETDGDLHIALQDTTGDKPSTDEVAGKSLSFPGGGSTTLAV
jgi:hypothetical protein